MSFVEQEVTMLLKPAAYSTEELHFLRSVPERCTADLEPSRRSSEIKPAMAERILGCAAIGERNPTKLRIAAMRGAALDSSDLSALAAIGARRQPLDSK